MQLFHYFIRGGRSLEEIRYSTEVTNCLEKRSFEDKTLAKIHSTIPAICDIVDISFGKVSFVKEI